MPETPPPAQTKDLRLVGLEFAPPRQRADLERDAELVRQAMAGGPIDPRLMPRPRPAVLPVFEDEPGQLFIIEQTPLGPVTLPFVSGTPLDLAGGERGGGYTPLSEIEALAGRASPAGGADPGVGDVRSAALQAFLKGGRPGNDPGGGDHSGSFGTIAQSLGQGIGQQVFNAGVDAYAKNGGIGQALGFFAEQDPADLLKGLGLGAAQQLVGMATQMLFSSLFSVDDESSTAEQAAHKYAQEALGMIQGEMINQALAAFQGKAPTAIVDRIRNFFALDLGSGLPAVRVGDLDEQGNPVLAGSPDVIIEGMPAGREQDRVKPPGAMIYQGSGTVLTNGIFTARVQTSASAVGKFSKGATKTLIGGPAAGALPPLPPAAAGAGGDQGGMCRVPEEPSELEKLLHGSNRPDENIYYMSIQSETATGDPDHGYMNPIQPGHASILISGVEDSTRAMSIPVTQTLGAYPEGVLDNFFDSGQRLNDVVINDRPDYAQPRVFSFISTPVPITADQYRSLMEFSSRPFEYQVRGNNCIDYAVAAYNHTLQQTVFAPETEYFGIGSPRRLGAQILDSSYAVG